MSSALPDPIAPFIAARGLFVMDGALATELETRGADLNDPLWSARVLLENPALIREVNDAYLQAGADMATSATYQASFEGFAARGIDADGAERLMRLSVRIAIEARDAYWATRTDVDATLRPLVVASVGPYGAFLADGSEYRGNYDVTEDDLVAWHRPRLAVLADSGADLLAFETIPCAAEARAILRLLDELPESRAWISFSARDGEHISSGESFASVAQLVGAHAQVVAVGINCTPPEHVESLIRAARAVTETRIAVYPNSGERYVPGERRWETGAACAPFAELAATWLAAGATMIGGCCRTTPADIAVVRGLASAT